MYSSRFARRSVSVDILAVRPSNLSGEHITWGNSVLLSLLTIGSSASNSTNAKIISSVVLGNPTSVTFGGTVCFSFRRHVGDFKFQIVGMA